MPYPVVIRAVAAAVLTTLGCGGCGYCSREDPGTPKAVAEDSADRLMPDSSVANPGIASIDVKLSNDGGRMSTDRDAGALNGREPSSSGDKSSTAIEVDTANRYASAVMVTTNSSMKEGGEVRCSGALIGPRIVLTAAHCVCAPAAMSGSGGKQGDIDAAACAQKATVTAVAYEAPSHGEEFSYVNKEYKGRVRPHPEFKMVLDRHGHMLSAGSDLAVVLLEKPMRSVVPSEISGTEIKEGDSIVVVAFIDDEAQGGIDRKRSFSKAKVLSAPRAGTDRFLMEWSDLVVGRGASGGACLSEAGQGFVLMGVAVGAQDKQVVCVSIYPYQAWLEKEIQQAGEVSAP